MDIVNTNVNGYNVAKELFLRKQVKDMDVLEKEEMYTIEDVIKAKLQMKAVMALLIGD